MKDTKQKLSPITITLHWIVGLTIIGLLAVGIFMKETETFSLYPIHKSIGVLIFAIVLVRVVWRISNGWLEPVSVYSSIEQLLAKVVHWVLIIGTVLMPVSGMMMSGGGGHGFGIFGLEIMARNPDPTNPKEVIPLNETVGGIGHEVHEILGWVLVVAVILHIAGALKHHIVDKDGTLRRMLGAQVD